MITTGIYLDCRRQKKDGTCSVRLRIIRDRKVYMLATGMSCRPEEWENERFSRKSANSMQKNALLNKWMSEIDGFLMEAERRGDLDRMSMVDIISMAEKVIKGESKNAKKLSFSYVLDEYIVRKGLKANTRQLYLSTRDKIEEFSKDVRLDAIKPRFLEDMEMWMKSNGLRTNSISIHMRNIRAVINYAIDEEYTSLYPFRKFKIKKEATEKRCLSVEEIKKLRDYPVEEYQKIYRDMFMLMFYLIGINAVDLFGAKKEQVQNGRLVYKRAKTGTLYSIKIQPEAEKIIKTYTGDGDYLLNILDRYGNYKDFLHRMNKNLHRIGEYERKGKGGRKVITSAFPGLSSYWSRHTWATIAAELDIPIETISHALGHSIGSDVTAIYVKFNRIKIDEANRKVLDFLK